MASKWRSASVLPNGIVGRGEDVDQVEHVGQVAPENFFFEGAETERGGAALLCEAGMIVATEAVSRQFAAKPRDPFRRQIVAQELYCVGVGQIELGVGIEAGEPWAPVFAFARRPSNSTS